MKFVMVAEYIGLKKGQIVDFKGHDCLKSDKENSEIYSFDMTLGHAINHPEAFRRIDDIEHLLKEE